MSPLSMIETLFSNIGSIFTRIAYLYQQGSDTAKKPWLRRIVVTLVLLAIVVGLVFLALAVLPQLPMRFWQVLGLCVVVAVVLWWFMAGQRKASLKGRTRKRIGDLGPASDGEERAPVARMTAAITEAKRTIARAPGWRRGAPRCIASRGSCLSEMAAPMSMDCCVPVAKCHHSPHLVHHLFVI